MPFDKEPFVQEGIYDSHGKAVFPASLYLSQLNERLGEKALNNIGCAEYSGTIKVKPYATAENTGPDYLH